MSVTHNTLSGPEPRRTRRSGLRLAPSALERQRVRGAWHEGDPVGERRFVDIGDLELDSGVVIPAVRLAYEAWGRLNAARDNTLLVEHALTGDSHVVGEADDAHPSPGWWNDLLADGGPVDTDQWFVIAFNVLGGCQGSTGPSSTHPDGHRWGGRFPAVTIRDQVRAEARALDALGIPVVGAVIGGSMGGMRALEWAVTEPERVHRCIVLASTPFATADQIAWCEPQLLAIKLDPNFHAGDYYTHGVSPDAGMGIARRIAHTTYRTEYELSERFGRAPQEVDLAGRAAHGLHSHLGRPRFAVEGYLDHHAGKLQGRFDANSYLVLTEAMNSHDVARGRGELPEVLGRITARCTIVAVDTDRLYVPRLSELMAQHIPGARYGVIHSDYGHDGFLIEQDQVATFIREALSD